MSQMLKSSGAMAAATMASRVLGMLREMAYASFMGDKPVASAFQFAFQIPNLFRRLLGEGALNAAFIPIFKEKEKTEGEEAMWASANAVISGLVIAGALITGVVTILITLLFSARLDENTRLMLELLRVMFPYMPVICLTAIFMGMLNARGSFFVPALGAVILNIILIATVFFITPLFGKTLEQQIFALAYGVLVAGIAQAAFQLPQLFKGGFRFRWVKPWGNPTVQQVVRKMVPGMLGVATFQLNVVLTSSIAFHVDDTIIASFNYAVRFMELPQGLFGISLATYLLPTLSGLAAEKKYDEFRSTLGQGFSYLVFINLLASVLLIILAEPIIRLIFERGEFTAYSTFRSAQALKYLGPGLVFFSLTNIFARAFYALGDTKTPMKISVFCLLLNVIFAWFLIRELLQAGLALANTITAGISVGLLIFALRKKLKRLDLGLRAANIFPQLLCVAVASGLSWGALRLWNAQIGHSTFFSKLGEVFVPMLVGAGGYFALALFLKIPAAKEILGMFRMGPRKSPENPG